MKYVLNNYYILRHDKCRTFILGGRNGRIGNEISVDENWKSIIHPAYAMMLSFFSNPIELEDAANAISDFLSCSKDMILTFLNHMINATDCWHTSLSGFDSGFPKNLIIPAECKQYNKIIKYSPLDFKFSDLNPNSRRMLSGPLSIVWMPNNNCYTACEYCYADRRYRNHVFSLDKIESFVKDAANSGVTEIMLTGGDFFVNPHWEEILTVLKREGYNIDMISTKKPLSIKELEAFKKFNIRFQVSFDAASDAIAINLLRVKAGYVSSIKEMLQIIDRLGIQFQVATVLTNINDSISNLEKLYTFLGSLIHMNHWEIRVGFRSLYSKADFNSIKSSRSQIKEVADWISIKQ